ncbi:MAG TPA: hypothetical protein VGH74_06630 [Planctomycetaceae bacterium]|jgi:hypothetical protein
MFLRYGAYTHANNEPAVQIGKQAVFSRRGYRRAVRETWRIVGVLHAADQPGLTSAIAALRSAYNVNGLDLGLYLDDGVTPTDHVLISTAALGGTRVTALEFPSGTGAEYSTYRSYSISVEADFPDTSNNLLDFSETLSFEGSGGPRMVFLDTLAGLPQQQIARQRTTYRARQEGRAVGLATYPAVAPPIWPAAELQDQRRLILRAPRRVAGNLTDFVAEWTYMFESVSPLAGGPTVV